MRILLDSHVFVWAKADPGNLSHAARLAIIDPDNEVFLSLASAWELWIKHAKKPIAEIAPVLDSGASGFLKAAADSGIALLDITLRHAATAASLPAVHRDPFDRMIIAQGIVDDLVVMTDDPAFKRYKRLRLFGV